MLEAVSCDPTRTEQAPDTKEKRQEWSRGAWSVMCLVPELCLSQTQIVLRQPCRDRATKLNRTK
jgi:hypothetical protein